MRGTAGRADAKCLVSCVQLGANKAGLIKLIAGATVLAETDMRKEKKKVGGVHVRG